jgi:hypothetical protein
MTYREQIDNLLGECARKADAYVEAVRRSETGPETQQCRQAWERAEQEYKSCLDRLRSNEVKLEDTVREGRSENPAGR